jgi:hypothetical protein
MEPDENRKLLLFPAKGLVVVVWTVYLQEKTVFDMTII